MPQNWVGKTIGQVDIRKKFNINIMALKRDGKLDMAIRPDTMLTDDATMLVLGESVISRNVLRYETIFP